MENKLPVKFNAVKHGLLAKSVVLSDEDKRPFNKLTKVLLAELQPETVLEKVLAEQIIIQYWRLRRFLKLENEILLFAGKPKWSFDQKKDFIEIFTEFVKSNPSFELLPRYNASILRSFYRSLHEYQNIKLTQKLNVYEEKTD